MRDRVYIDPKGFLVFCMNYNSKFYDYNTYSVEWEFGCWNKMGWQIDDMAKSRGWERIE